MSFLRLFYGFPALISYIKNRGITPKKKWKSFCHLHSRVGNTTQHKYLTTNTDIDANMESLTKKAGGWIVSTWDEYANSNSSHAPLICLGIAMASALSFLLRTGFRWPTDTASGSKLQQPPMLSDTIPYITNTYQYMANMQLILSRARYALNTTQAAPLDHPFTLS